MWLPWRKPAAVLLGEKRLLVEGLGDAREVIETDTPIEELERLIDRLRGYQANVFIGAGLVQLTAVPRVTKLWKHVEKLKAASVLARLPLSEWQLTVVDPSTDSAWLVYAMNRQVFQELAKLRSKYESRIRSIKPHSGVVFESLLARGDGVGMVSVYESESGQLSWLIASDRNVKSAGQVSGIAPDLIVSEATRVSLANGIPAIDVRVVSFDSNFVGGPRTSMHVGRKSIAFNELLNPVLAL